MAGASKSRVPSVLIVEDHAQLAEVLAQSFREAGYAVAVARDGAVALAQAREGEHDAIVLDLQLPKIDGLTLLRRLRDDGYDTPVLILSARDEVADRVLGLDTGADDYLAKPFALVELFARVRTLIRRRRGAAAQTIRVADLEVDTAARVARRAGVRIELSPREYAILECLAHRRGRVVTREALCAEVYDGEHEPASNVIDVYVGYLRRKIDRGHARRLIHTRRGLGYVLGEAG